MPNDSPSAGDLQSSGEPQSPHGPPVCRDAVGGLAGDAVVGRVLDALMAMQRLSWEQGVASHAALDLGLHDTALLLARGAMLRQAGDGRLGDAETGTASVNSGACGEAVWHAARRTGDDRWSAALDRQLDWLLHRAPRAADGTLFHLTDSRQVWADTVYMVLPLLALTGHVDAALAQVAGHRRRLHDERTGLYAATWDEDTGALIWADHWGTGNGWVVAAIARALRLGDRWPEGARRDLAGHARDVIDACLACRSPAGVFHDVLDDAGTFAEANVGQMLAYATLTGVADGWLPAPYAEVGRDLVAAARRQVDGYGVVTGVCGCPRFDRPGTSAEAQAFFLLAHAALARLSATLP